MQNNQQYSTERQNARYLTWVCGLFAIFPGRGRDTNTFIVTFHGASPLVYLPALLPCGHVFCLHSYCMYGRLLAGCAAARPLNPPQVSTITPFRDDRT